METHHVPTLHPQPNTITRQRRNQGRRDKHKTRQYRRPHKGACKNHPDGKTKNTRKAKNDHATEQGPRAKQEIQPTNEGSIQQKEKVFNNKMQQRGRIARLARKWDIEKLEQDAEKPQIEAGGTTCAHYGSTRATANLITRASASLQNKDGTLALGGDGEMSRWAKRIEGNFYKPDKELRHIEIERINEDHWGQIDIHYHEQANAKINKKHTAQSEPCSIQQKIRPNTPRETYKKYANSTC